eukprot:gnl/MRDRNA2_/MRDRNA2_79195_c0_seq1.p1 gnl/MRDRNA2_/MRDRNA2_79195_c0~~gnl/MRDRNA2_/MRDRNA2_79195_c0_seq1.p1  ORF type:complete len:535 (+),score=134.20 gnl/MRDRNA2_/MRDRNA2_79195_c0_seq1:92-1696(+)
MSMKCYLECTEGGSSKFWQCLVKGNDTIVTFGKIGTAGLQQKKTHASPGHALQFFEKMKKEKQKKGYTAKGGKAASPASKAPSSPAPMKRKAEASTPASPPMKAAKITASSTASSSKKARKGGKAVDSKVPDAASFSVHDEYAVKLNQTNIADANNNKFYIIQVLEGKGGFWAWNRWGRVGDPGMNKLVKCSSADAAIKDFKKKFRDKSANDWENRDDFTPKKGKYTIVETDDAADGADASPMGKLSEKQISKGQAVLNKLEKVLKSGSKSTVDELSGEFYTLIPHNFGWKKPPSIDTKEILQQKMELLNFYLRMGFDDVGKKTSTPISGVLEIPVPKTLAEATTGVCSGYPLSSSMELGNKLKSKQAGKPRKPMNADQYGSICLYTGNAIYTALNQALRNEDRAKIKKYFKYLRLFLDALDHLPKQKRTLWRGIGVDLHSNPNYKVGGTVTWWGVSSTTSDQNVAKNFAGGCAGDATVLTIDAKSATDVSALSFYSSEKESLLPPGTQFKVKSNSKKGKTTEICLQEIGSALK